MNTYKDLRLIQNKLVCSQTLICMDPRFNMLTIKRMMVDHCLRLPKNQHEESLVVL